MPNQETFFYYKSGIYVFDEVAEALETIKNGQRINISVRQMVLHS